MNRFINCSDSFLLEYDFDQLIYLLGSGINQVFIGKLIEKNKLINVQTISLCNVEASKDFFCTLAKIDTLKTLQIPSRQREASKFLIDEFQKLRPDVSITE